MLSNLYLPAKCLFAIATKYTTPLLVTVNALTIHYLRNSRYNATRNPHHTRLAEEVYTELTAK